MKHPFRVFLGLLTLLHLAHAGGSPSTLNGRKSQLPYTLNSEAYTAVSDKLELLKLLESTYDELKSPECLQNILLTPGHRAREAAGYKIQSLNLKKTVSLLNVWIEYSLPDGTSGRGAGNFVSNGFPSAAYICELK